MAVDGEFLIQREFEYLALARVLRAQKRYDQAVDLLQRLQDGAEANGRTSRFIETLILHALTLQDAGDIDQALVALTHALTTARPGGFIQVFVDEGQSMASLLQEAQKRAIAPEYTGELIAAFRGEPGSTGPKPEEADQSGMIEPLSERELDVLHCIAEGLTNKAIANRLYLSPNTVKVHARNIFSKLDVHSRVQAVAKARDLGLLSSR